MAEEKHLRQVRFPAATTSGNWTQCLGSGILQQKADRRAGLGLQLLIMETDFSELCTHHVMCLNWPNEFTVTSICSEMRAFLSPSDSF